MVIFDEELGKLTVLGAPNIEVGFGPVVIMMDEGGISVLSIAELVELERLRLAGGGSRLLLVISLSLMSEGAA